MKRTKLAKKKHLELVRTHVKELQPDQLQEVVGAGGVHTTLCASSCAPTRLC